jgi:glycosyl transferase family 61
VITSRPALLSFRDIVVTPYTDLLDGPFGGEYHRGGPRWPQWSTQIAARHGHAGVPIDVEPPDAEPTSTLRGPVAWGGAMVGHFGHQIADFTSRLLPTLAEKPDARFAFSMRDRIARRSWQSTPESFRAILGWCGITGEQVELIIEPTLVDHLVVAPQGEQLGAEPEPWYLDLLDAHTRSQLGEIERRGSLYVSRAGQRARFAGEAYLESMLEEVGFRVLRPEAVPLEEQLRAYASAESIVFAEGSALHGPQLMGRALGDVTVLVRRAGLSLARQALTVRARSLRYVDALRGSLQCVLIGGKAWPFAGLAILDPEKLLAALPIAGAWQQDVFAAAVDSDVEEWLETERASPRTGRGVFSPELAAESLRAAGLAPRKL